MTNTLTLLLFSFSLLLTLETTTYNNPKNFFEILYKRPIAFLYNIFIIFSLLVFLNLFNIPFRFSFLILYVIFIIFGIINYQLRFYRNEYFKPIDVKLFKESKEISKTLSLKFPFLILPITLINILVLLNPIFNSYKKNMFSNIIVVLIFLCICILLQNKNYTSKYLKLKINEYSDFDDFKDNGFLLTFIMNFNTLFSNKPKNYEQGISKKILEHIETKTPDKKPNIIIIMNESFFNINNVEGIKLSENPLPNFTDISSKFTNGNVISPVLGGGTCQPEYEMLTGNSVFFTYKFKIAFLEFFKNINKTKDGICLTLKKLSYSSLFIHPYSKYFYNRNKAYKALGFDKIIDINDFKDAKYPRMFVSDKDCYKKLIYEFEQKQQNKPFFSVVVTMQNHPDYINGKKYNEHNISVLNEEISKNEKIMLENYVNLLKESDNAIKYLTDYFEDKKDTVILFFGDHQPSENIGFSSISIRNILELSRTPFFIWDNFGLEKTNYNDISPSFITPILFNKINNKSDAYFNYLFEKLHILKAFNTSFVINSKNTYINRRNSSEKIKNTLKELELVQFDRINHW